MDALSLGMLVCASIDFRRIYIGRNGVELVGFRGGTSRWRPLWLWWRGYLRCSGRIPWRSYGGPGWYLELTDAGRKIADLTKRDAARWQARRSV